MKTKAKSCQKEKQQLPYVVLLMFKEAHLHRILRQWCSGQCAEEQVNSNTCVQRPAMNESQGEEFNVFHLSDSRGGWRLVPLFKDG